MIQSFPCGSIAYKFVANDKFDEVRLIHDSLKHVLTLAPKDFDTTGVFTGSYLEYYFVEYPARSWRVQIEAKVEPCQILSAEFALNRLERT